MPVRSSDMLSIDTPIMYFLPSSLSGDDDADDGRDNVAIIAPMVTKPTDSFPNPINDKHSNIGF